jgi:transposase
MRAVVGKKTAAVLAASVGDPRNYSSAEAFVKSLGLNLKEKSSGKEKGGLHITKRGPGVARMMLYMAVLRLIQTDAVVRAWYAKKVSQLGGRQKSKAIVAIMRKLAGALWHVAKGSPFDSTKLFDTRRLNLLAIAEAS